MSTILNDGAPTTYNKARLLLAAQAKADGVRIRRYEAGDPVGGVSLVVAYVWGSPKAWRYGAMWREL